MMEEAFHFYRGIHRQYVWLHVIFSIFLLVTSIFWFVLPFYVVNYGDYEPTLLLKFVSVLFLCIFPPIFITLHCWIISFIAAKKWSEQKIGESFIVWLICFQAMAFLVVLIFTIIIYALFLLIDSIT